MRTRLMGGLATNKHKNSWARHGSNDLILPPFQIFQCLLRHARTPIVPKIAILNVNSTVVLWCNAMPCHAQSIQFSGVQLRRGMAEDAGKLNSLLCTFLSDTETVI